MYGMYQFDVLISSADCKYCTARILICDLSRHGSTETEMSLFWKQILTANCWLQWTLQNDMV